MNRSNLMLLSLAVVLAACGPDEANGSATNNDTCLDGERCVDPADMGPGTEDSGGGGGDEDTGTTNNTDPDMGGIGGDDDAMPADMGGDEDAGMACDRTPEPADRDRKVVVGLPFTDTQYEVFDLSAAGDLSQPGTTFTMGRAFEGKIQFTPDGEVGFVAQDDGTLGVFRFNDSGQPEVLAAKMDPGFYVSGIRLAPSGDYLYGWESGFRDVGGALYRMEIDCASGMPAAAESLAPTKLMRGGVFLGPGRMAVAATDILDDERPNDVHLVDLDGPSRVASIPAFGTQDAITAGFDVTADGEWALIGDNSVFNEDQNSVAAVRIDGDALTAGQRIDIQDPVQIVTSPFDNAAIVLSTTDDNINVLGYTPGANNPFALQGPLDVAESSLLPGSATMIHRGSLEGLVLVGENVAIRRVQFEANGDVTDLGILDLGDGNDAITGAIGVQP